MSDTSNTQTSAAPRFVVVGAGGLGCPALLGLVSAGAQRVLLLDFDAVEASNLQRQVLFDMGDVGASKATAAARNLRRRVPELDIQTDTQRLSAAQVPAFVEALRANDVVLECTDDAEVKFAFNDACRARDLPLVLGGVVGWQGRAMAVHGAGPCYRCFFEAPPAAAGIARCADAGVMGAGAGVVGQLMAALAWQLAERSEGRDIAGRLHVLDFRDLHPRVLTPPARKDCPACNARPKTTTTSTSRSDRASA